MPTTDDTEPGPPSRGRVLIVEDDRATSRYLEVALERAGFIAESVGDAIGAERYLESVDCDALLVDIGLPGPSGFDLVREMKAAHPHMPMALMTADASMDVAVRALRSEVDDFLAKPIEPKALIEQVDRLVRRGRLSQAGVERVLAIGAHPADVEVGVGGILLWHRFMGDEVAVATMTQGVRGGPIEAPGDEAAHAAALLGARLFPHDLEETHISESEPTVSLIEGVVEEFAPTIIYTHSWNDLNPDHRHTHRASLVAARRVPTVYCYESPSATVDFRPAKFTAVDPFLDKKIEVIGAYGSQIEERPHLDPELVRSTSRYWGRFGDSRYCEPLEVVRDLALDHTPVTAEDARARA